MNTAEFVARVVSENRQSILSEWLGYLKAAGGSAAVRMKDAELQQQCSQFIDLFIQGADGGANDVRADKGMRDMLSDISRARAIQGFSPTETAVFIFSLKRPLFDAFKKAAGKDVTLLGDAVWEATQTLDGLGLHTTEIFLRSREEVVVRQQKEIAELSTPVVKLWDGILALPLIGTLDSERTSVVMENLLQALIDNSADFAIIDITGVPTVDTLVAQHLLKTVAAARLMGADCLISGIRPQIAQTMVHLGVELNVQSKATLAEAFREALKRTGRTVVSTDRLRTKSAPGQ
jgi:rsbT co-antagonist protein RsbR